MMMMIIINIVKNPHQSMLVCYSNLQMTSPKLIITLSHQNLKKKKKTCKLPCCVNCLILFKFSCKIIPFLLCCTTILSQIFVFQNLSQNKWLIITVFLILRFICIITFQILIVIIPCEIQVYIYLSNFLTFVNIFFFLKKNVVFLIIDKIKLLRLKRNSVCDMTV